MSLIACLFVFLIGGIIFLLVDSQNDSKLVSSDTKVKEYLNYEEGSNERESIHALEEYLHILTDDYNFEDSLKYLDRESLNDETYERLKAEAADPLKLTKYHINEPSCSFTEGQAVCFINTYAVFEGLNGGIGLYRLIEKDGRWLITFSE
ncbi:hypothetical protein [Sutcliffiella sp. FSL R7-0096]|uniref:hypothetical protein n=1 Tax=Sutcliffiella sp. FSL R7-0096 TaxID=2921670 RepID=UPI00315A549A